MSKTSIRGHHISQAYSLVQGYGMSALSYKKGQTKVRRLKSSKCLL